MGVVAKPGGTAELNKKFTQICFADAYAAFWMMDVVDLNSWMTNTSLARMAFEDEEKTEWEKFWGNYSTVWRFLLSRSDEELGLVGLGGKAAGYRSVLQWRLKRLEGKLNRCLQTPDVFWEEEELDGRIERIRVKIMTNGTLEDQEASSEEEEEEDEDDEME
jgi:hypothetical protein